MRLLPADGDDESCLVMQDIEGNVLSRLSGRQRERAVGLPAPLPLHLAGSRRAADGPRHDRSRWSSAADRSVAAVRCRGRMARGRGRSVRRDTPSDHRNRHPAVASTACILKRPPPARLVDSPPPATPVETFADAANPRERLDRIDSQKAVPPKVRCGTATRTASLCRERG
jgi:hypothetical protein